MLLLAILVIGLAAGWIGDVVVNRRMRPPSWGRVFVYGLIGSFVGGLLISLLAGDGLNLFERTLCLQIDHRAYMQAAH